MPVAGLGLGAEVARAAEGVERRGLDDQDLGPDPDAPGVPPVRGGRLALVVAGLTLLVLLLGGATLVGMRSGSDPALPAATPSVAEGAVATIALPAAVRPRPQGTTTAPTTTDETTDEPGGAAAPPAGPSAPVAAPATTVVGGVVRITPAPTTRRAPAMPPGAAAAPGAVGVGASPSPGAGGSTAAPATTDAPGEPDPPRTTAPTPTEAPPTTDAPPTTEDPPTTEAPPMPTGTTPAF